VLIAGITSLPELATVVTASLSGTGIDSIAILVVYLGGVVVLYQLR
jgi:hypothetical protein